MHNTGFSLWFTGLSGSGKSTLATYLLPILEARGQKVEILHCDEVRENLSKGLGFSKEDRDINIRRIGWVANLWARNGCVAITAAISPYREIRDEIRQLTQQRAHFVEVYVEARYPTECSAVVSVLGSIRQSIRQLCVISSGLPQIAGSRPPFLASTVGSR